MNSRKNKKNVVNILNLMLLSTLLCTDGILNATQHNKKHASAITADLQQEKRKDAQDEEEISTLKKQLAAQANGQNNAYASSSSTDTDTNPTDPDSSAENNNGDTSENSDNTDTNQNQDNNDSVYSDPTDDSSDASSTTDSSNSSSATSGDSGGDASSQMSSDQMAALMQQMGGGGQSQQSSAPSSGGLEASIGSIMNSPYVMVIQTLLFAGGPLMEVFHYLEGLLIGTVNSGKTKEVQRNLKELGAELEKSTKEILAEKRRLNKILAESTDEDVKAAVRIEIQKLDISHDLIKRYGGLLTDVNGMIKEKKYLSGDSKKEILEKMKADQSENYQKLADIIEQEKELREKNPAAYKEIDNNKQEGANGAAAEAHKNVSDELVQKLTASKDSMGQNLATILKNKKENNKVYEGIVPEAVHNQFEHLEG